MTPETSQPKTEPNSGIIIVNGQPQPGHKLTREEQSKGGKVKNEKTHRRNIIASLKVKKCRNCTLPCPYKQLNLRKDLNHMCMISPQAYLTLRMGSDKNAIVQKLNQLLMEAEEAVRSKGKPQDWARLMQVTQQFAEYIEPKDIVIDMNVDHRITVEGVQGLFRPAPKPVTVIEVKKESEVKTS